MQRDDGADKRRKVHDEELVVGRDGEWPLGALRALAGVLGRVQVREQVEDVLEVVDDLVVDRQCALDDALEVLLDLRQPALHPAQRRELVRDARRQRADGKVLDVAQEVLDSDLLSLLGLDRRRDVDERLLRRRAVLQRRVSWGAGGAHTGARTSLISSTAKYASVGIPPPVRSLLGRTSTMTMTGFVE